MGVNPNDKTAYVTATGYLCMYAVSEIQKKV
jgi:hypothetical protein